MARLIFPKHWEGFANDGERKVIEFLAENLPLKGTVQRDFSNWGMYGEEYVVMPNFTLPGPGGMTAEIDGVVVAPHAVYLIEIKDWNSRIEGDDKGWVLNDHYERPNPNYSISTKAKKLAGAISRDSYDIKRNVFFTHIVVIVNPETELNLSGECLKTTHTRDERLIQYIQDFGRLQPKLGRLKVTRGGIQFYQQEIAAFISGQASKQSGPKIINGYQVIEELIATSRSVEYLAKLATRHGSSGSTKRLRVFRLPLHLADSERKKREERIFRDYKALDMIGNHPNIVGLRGEPMEHNSDQIVEVLDWSEEGTLRTVMKQGTVTFEQSLEIIQGIAQGLKAIHEAKGLEVVHRDLRPENILMRQNTPQLMNFDKAFLYAEGQEFETVYTRTGDEDEIPPERHYLPPELDKRDYETYPSSDLYSLGAIFYELLVGELPYTNPVDFAEAGGKLSESLLPTQKAPGLPVWVDELINKLYCCEESERFQSASEFLAALKAAQEPSEKEVQSQVPTPLVVVEPEPESDEPNRVLQPGERIAGYRIIRLISTGAFAQVYQATHVHRDKEYALKVYNDSAPLKHLKRELDLLNRCDHPHIVKVIWSDPIPGGRHYIVMEYLNGEPLSKYAWGKNSQKKLPYNLVIEAGLQITDALSYLHTLAGDEGEILHRDVKPNNIMWVKDRGFILIDFNISVDKTSEEAKTEIGTTPYVPPDRWFRNRIEWDASCDTYALGVTLYELVCKTHPYPEKQAKVDLMPKDPRNHEGNKNLAPGFAEFLLKAVMPKAEDRFQNAREMSEALQNLKDSPLYWSDTDRTPTKKVELTQDEVHKENYNPFVNRLRRLFSQAQFSNAGTRGLDEIARQTYIQTKLDRELAPAILSGEFKLIMITGNAGDGKTALIQQIEARIQEQGGKVEYISSQNGSRFKIKGIVFETNYDGSQDEGDLSNDQVLERFLSPFARVKDLSKVNSGRILAINEGRLVEFLADKGRQKQFGFLYEQVDRYFNERASHDLPGQMIIINLNWRSIVARQNRSSLLEDQLEALLDGEFWRSCHQCEFKGRCFIQQNVVIMGDSAGGSEIRNRLVEIFEGVHLQRELHMTMRDLRSALSWLIARDQSCEDVAAQLQNLNSLKSKLDYLEQFYWNITDTEQNQGGKDRLVQKLQALDIGQVADPGIDRDLHFMPLSEFSWLALASREESSKDFSLVLMNQVREALELLPPQEALPFQMRLHRLLVRKIYFESRQEMKQRLPYLFLDSFKSILESKVAEKREQVRDNLVYAISLSEGCRNPDLASSHICLAATSTKDPRYSTFRLFAKEDFEIEVPQLGKLGSYLEHMPDRFILKHKDPKYESVVLEVNLNLFEILNHISRGFTPSMNDLQGHFIELIIFKNALRNLPYHSVLVSEDQQDFYQISAINQRLVMEKY